MQIWFGYDEVLKKNFVEFSQKRLKEFIKKAAIKSFRNLELVMAALGWCLIKTAQSHSLNNPSKNLSKKLSKAPKKELLIYEKVYLH
jgi:hypothetical protein